MISIEKNIVKFNKIGNRDKRLRKEIKRGFIDVQDSLFKELKDNAELQAKSEADAMTNSSYYLEG